MKYIISGTNRPQSRTMDVSKLLQKIWSDLGETVQILDLRVLGLTHVDGGQYAEHQPPEMAEATRKILTATGVIVVSPEYNGSFPGILKYFIDHWKYPDCFEFRPCCFVGLGGRFGGMRGVEHLQQIFGYRNAYIYPERVFLTDIWHNLKNGDIQDARIKGLLLAQAKGFQKYTAALMHARLDANSVLADRAAVIPV